MKTTRKRYSVDFKAKVALEAIRGDLTLAELAAKSRGTDFPAPLAALLAVASLQISAPLPVLR